MQPYISTNYSQYFLETPLELQFASLHQFYLLAHVQNWFQQVGKANHLAGEGATRDTSE